MARPHRPPFAIQHVYIADGFADDCDELIHRCSRVDILSYHTFCIYYKEMNFSSLYQGRTSNAEIAELSEEVLQIAKYYMVLDTSNFEESVAGLFLVYALLSLQPYPGFASLRLIPDDLPALARIQQVARRTRRLDVLYVLGSVLNRGPVQFHAAARPRGMESSMRKYLEGFCNIDITGVRPKGVYFRQNEELDIIRDMAGIFKRYSHAKGLIPGLERRVLSYSNDNLAVELGTSLKKLINGIVEEQGVGDMQHHDAVQEIKKRAMRNVVSTVRHLDSAEQRSPEKKIQRGKYTIASGSKSNKSQTKTKILPKKAQKRKARSSSSSEENDIDYTENETQNNDTDWCIASHGNLDEINKTEQEIYVEIDSLPSLITTESDGRLVEIEIIDEMKESKRDGDTKKPKRKTKKEDKRTKAEINSLPSLETTGRKLVEIEIFDEMKEKSERDSDTSKPKRKTKKTEKDSLPSSATIESKRKLVEIEIFDEIKQKCERDSDTINEKEKKEKRKTKKKDEKTKVEINSVTSLATTESKRKLVEIEIIDQMEQKSDGDSDNIKEKEKKEKRKTKKKDEKTKVEINSLPSAVTASNRKLAEIEIIDKMKQKSEGDSETIKEKEKKEKRKTDKDDFIFKRPLRVSPRLKTVQKRDMKKVLVKSKFKKMGMLPVANFEEQE